MCVVKSQPWLSVTEAGQESITLRTAARKAIPMLMDPEMYSASERQEVADNLASLLGTTDKNDTHEVPKE